VLFSSTAPSHLPALRAVEDAAARLGLKVDRMPVRGVEDLDGAFAAMDRVRVDGFLVVASSLTFSKRAHLAELGLTHRLPGMFGTKDNVVAGGLMSYAPDFSPGAPLRLLHRSPSAVRKRASLLGITVQD